MTFVFDFSADQMYYFALLQIVNFLTYRAANSINNKKEIHPTKKRQLSEQLRQYENGTVT
jgi:hypothetical protein